MSRLWRCLRELTCSVTVIVLAGGCEEAPPGSMKETASVGFTAIEFSPGEIIREISLVNTFSGTDLTYRATSRNPSIATVTVDNNKDTLTVTAKSPGTTTITVTATSSTGSAVQSFAVTVLPTPEQPPDEPEPPVDEPEDDPPEPTPEAEAPIVKPGVLSAVDVDEGKTETVTLSAVFDGKDLEYTVTSSNHDVATASETAGILFISAHSAGDAVITVTATNAVGNVKHTIKVKVPQPAPPPSSTLTIELHETVKHTLPSGQILAATSDGVRVGRVLDNTTSNVWFITALEKGTHTISIFSGVGVPKRIGQLTVEVPNSPPVRRHDVADPPTVATIGADQLYITKALDLYDFFSDEDGDALRFIVGSKPSWVLIESADGFVKTVDDHTTDAKEAKNLKFEVLETPPETSFTVSIYAVDNSGDETQLPVVLPFATADMSARTREYTVTQTATGDLNQDGSLEVGQRLVAGTDRHAVTFEAPTDKTGFVFAASAYETLAEAGKVNSTTRPIEAKVHVKQQDGTYSPDLPDETVAGFDYFTVESTGSIVLDGSEVTLSKGPPSIPFQLKRGESGSIVVKYFVWALDGNMEPSKKSYQETLRVNVVTCNSPPNPIADCP